MNTLTFDQNSFYLDGKPFRMIAGDIHYFRIHPSRWEEVLDLSADFGLNTIQSYVPWNAHEPEPGVYDLSGLQWSDKPHTEHLPCFFRGTFTAKRGVDSYVNFSDWGHGYIWVNGVNLGRYDSVGPHRTLYIPGAYLQEHNEIILLDLDPVGRRDRILLEDHEMLEGDGAELQ